MYACLPLDAIVMAGNSLEPPHVEKMTTFSRPLNAMVLIIGGYILHAALIGTTIYELAKGRREIIKTS